MTTMHCHLLRCVYTNCILESNAIGWVYEECLYDCYWRSSLYFSMGRWLPKGCQRAWPTTLFCTNFCTNTGNVCDSSTCYIPIFYFKLCPKFPFLFHTLMFLMSSYSILWRFRCFPYSDVFLFHTPMFPMFPTVFWRLSALWCFPYSDISEILLFHSIPSPCSDVFWCFPHFYRCRTFLELLWAHYHHGTFLVTSWTIFPKHHNLGSIMDSLWMQ